MTSGVLWLGDSETDPRKQNQAIRQLQEGRTNARGSFTLTANSTTTTVSSPTCGLESVVSWQPITANAAAQMATLYCTGPSKRQFVLTHASNPTTDQNFVYVVLG